MSGIFHHVASMLGVPLNESDGISETEFDSKCQEINGTVPDSLRMFYCAAGASPCLAKNAIKFLGATEWFQQEDHLVFAEHTESDSQIAIVLNSEFFQQPPLEIKSGLDWKPLSNNLPMFLLFATHLNAAYGGMPSNGTSKRPEDLVSKIEQSEWYPAGKFFDTGVYSRPNRVIAFDESRVFVGAKTSQDLQKITDELGIEL